jgi:hypothetical protein
LSALTKSARHPIISRKNKKGTCGSADCGCHRKTRLFGPGTIVMLAAISVVIAIGAMNAPSDAKLKVSQLPAPTKPLNKPEPQSLLSADLNLTPDQKSRIATVVTEWKQERDRLTMAMSQFQPSQGRVDQISGSLQDYSSLSRQYDATRKRYWQTALALLTPDQRHEVER